MYSYTRIISDCSSQNPTRETRWRWRILDRTVISVWNSGSPCLDPGTPRFTATFVLSLRTPLYTIPNPPEPMIRLLSKLLVASFMSAMGIRRLRHPFCPGEAVAVLMEVRL
ncbi:hypothetical protein SAY86_016901 [Trapa natans]|uniref:Uncharacterized protein n=1 Tax=Trapa natans TaxID=22666 RepID=A0AAN7LPK5_TRANT|nr:hypothetical protein SAY86_016901 [Trapa natans]